MIKDIIFFYQIVITNVIFFVKSDVSLINECFLIWFLIYFYDFCFKWSTLNEYITREWQICIIFQFNALKSKTSE